MNKKLLLRVSFGLLISFGIIESATASPLTPGERAQAYKDCIAKKGCEGFKRHDSAYAKCKYPDPKGGEWGCNMACRVAQGTLTSVGNTTECK